MADFMDNYGGYNSWWDWYNADPSAATTSRINAAYTSQGQQPYYASDYKMPTYQQNLDTAFGAGTSNKDYGYLHSLFATGGVTPEQQALNIKNGLSATGSGKAGVAPNGQTDPYWQTGYNPNDPTATNYGIPNTNSNVSNSSVTQGSNPNSTGRDQAFQQARQNYNGYTPTNGQNGMPSAGWDGWNTSSGGQGIGLPDVLNRTPQGQRGGRYPG